MLYLLLLLPPAPVDSRAELSHDLARLSPAAAARLIGKVAKYRVELDSAPWEHEGRTLYDAATVHRGVLPSVWLRGAVEDRTSPLVVEGRLTVFWRPAWNGVAGYWELRVEEDRPLR